MFSVIQGVLESVYLGATVASIHSMVGLRMRTLGSAFFGFMLNMIGLDAGPFTTGMISDYLTPSLGHESLRYAMLYVIPVVQLWAMYHFYLASRVFREDAAAVPA